MDRTWWRSAHELDNDQRRIVQIPPHQGNHLITGPPGCGKTNILLLRASYLRGAGLGNCLVLVFTRMLREFIAAGSTRPNMLPENRIQTHANWNLSLLGRLGKPFRPSRDDLPFDEERQERHEALTNAIRSLRLRNTYYDSILLDEVQDYWKCEVDVLSRLTQRLFVVGDNQQRIYDRNEGIQAAVDHSCQEFRLSSHYRMGRKICIVADKLVTRESGESLEEFCQYDEHELPSRVDVHPTRDIGEQFSLLEINLTDQLRAFPNEWLGVFAVRRSTRDAVAEFLLGTHLRDEVQVQSDSEDDRRFDDNRRIVVSTLHSAKGSEFRSVHLVAADDFPYYTREKAFTATTRAKTTLDVYHSRPLEGSFESALSSRTVPNIDEIFT